MKMKTRDGGEVEGGERAGGERPRVSRVFALFANATNDTT